VKKSKVIADHSNSSSILWWKGLHFIIS